MTDKLRDAADAALSIIDVLRHQQPNSQILRGVSSMLREALAKPQECEWVYDDEGFFQSACKQVSFMPDLSIGHPDEYMKHCYGCGKRIRFI